MNLVTFNIHTDYDGKLAVSGPHQMRERDLWLLQNAIARCRLPGSEQSAEHLFVLEDGVLQLQEVHYPYIAHLERL